MGMLMIEASTFVATYDGTKTTEYIEWTLHELIVRERINIPDS